MKSYQVYISACIEHGMKSHQVYTIICTKFDIKLHQVYLTMSMLFDKKAYQVYTAIQNFTDAQFTLSEIIIIAQKKYFQKENITVMQRFLHCMFEGTPEIKNMHEIKMDYVNKNNVESNIHK